MSASENLNPTADLAALAELIKSQHDGDKEKIISCNDQEICFSEDWKLVCDSTEWVLASNTKSVEMVWKYVAEQAAEGSKIHIEVLKLVRESSPSVFVSFYRRPVLRIGLGMLVSSKAAYEKHGVDVNHSNMCSCHVDLNELPPGCEFGYEQAVLYAPVPIDTVKYESGDGFLKSLKRGFGPDKRTAMNALSSNLKSAGLDGKLDEATFTRSPILGSAYIEPFRSKLIRSELESRGMIISGENDDHISVEHMVRRYTQEESNYLVLILTYDKLLNTFSGFTHITNDDGEHRDRARLSWRGEGEVSDCLQYKGLSYSFNSLERSGIVKKVQEALAETAHLLRI